jgi:hypothetical protein
LMKTDGIVSPKNKFCCIYCFCSWIAVSQEWKNDFAVSLITILRMSQSFDCSFDVSPHLQSLFCWNLLCKATLLFLRREQLEMMAFVCCVLRWACTPKCI